MNIKIIDLLVWVAYILTLFFLIYWLLYLFEKREDIKKELKAKLPKLSTFPMVTIAIPAHNEQDSIIKTLQSVLAINYPKDKIEILIIDDGSIDHTYEKSSDYIQKHNIRNAAIIRHDVNKGKADALNTAVDKSKGELFACIDADSMVDKNALTYMVDMIINDPKLAIVTPVMKVHNPKTIIQKFQRLEYMSSMLVSRLMGYLDCMYVAPGPFSVYKTSVLKKLGKFDGKNLVEDQEIAWRAQKHHYKIRQCPNAIVYTIAPKNVKQLVKQRSRWYRGGIMTIKDYRSLAFNHRYGDFGMMQVPLIILFYVLPLLAIASFIYFVMRPLVRQLYDWFLIRFDIFTLFKDFKVDIRILDIDINQAIMIYLVLLITIVVLYIASRLTKEKVRTHGSIYILPYFFFYYIILSVIVAISLIEIVFRRKNKW